MKCLQLFIALLLISCSNHPQPREYEAEELLTIYEPKWFSASERHSLEDSQGRVQPHLFFDVNPKFTEKDQLTNVLVTTPENSHFGYNVDLVSGQRYYSGHYCNQGDVWNQKSGSFGRPYFSIAYMPRVLDQMGDPQKVIIFGGAERIKASLDHHFLRVRIIGGYVEETCPEANCLGRDTWNSRLVFVAVDPQDSTYSDIKDIPEFQYLQSWDKLQVTLQNMEGRNFSADRTYPYTRVRKLIPYRETIQYFRKRSAFMSDDELKKIQTSCHKLYDLLWKEVGEDRDEDRPSRNRAELDKKLKAREALKAKKLPVGKMARFQKFMKKYFYESATCEKFVYHGNINRDAQHFWFHSYIGMYVRLHKEGSYFDCRKKNWTSNIYNVNGDPVHVLPKEIDDCNDKDMDLAMDYLPNYLKSLKGVLGPFWRFIDYDTHEYGTHRKIYSWAKMNSRKYDCRPDPNQIIIEKMKVFPDDVSWMKWDPVDLEDDLKIIY